jgi:hypothetical protein
MANGYKGLRMSGRIKPTNMGNIRVQKGVDFIELAERGLITGTHEQTSTAGAGHKKNDSKFGSAISSSSVDMGRLDSASGITYDYGSIATAALTEETDKWAVRRAVASSRAIANAIPAGPTSRFTATWTLADANVTFTDNTHAMTAVSGQTNVKTGGPIAQIGTENMTWNADGTKAYIFYDPEYNFDGVNTFELSTPYDISTQTGGSGGSYHSGHGQQSSVSGARAGAQLVQGDSTLFYSNGNTLRMATLETPGDFSSTFTDTQEITISDILGGYSTTPQTTNNAHLSFDGTKLFLSFIHGFSVDANGVFTKNGGNYFKGGQVVLDVPTAFDLTSISSSDLISWDSFNYGIQSEQIQSQMNDIGTLLYVMNGKYPDKIYQYSLSTPWDLSTKTLLGSVATPFNANSQWFNWNEKLFNVSPDGNIITLVNNTGNSWILNMDFGANN